MLKFLGGARSLFSVFQTPAPGFDDPRREARGEGRGVFVHLGDRLGIVVSIGSYVNGPSQQCCGPTTLLAQL